MINNTDHNDPNYDFYFNQAASEQRTSHRVPVVDPLTKQLKCVPAASFIFKLL